MDNTTCGDCIEFIAKCDQCGNPMVYLDHTDNEFATTKDTASCGFFYGIKIVVKQ